jgi:hypothetical protein
MFTFILWCGFLVSLLASGWVWQHAWTVSKSGIHEILAALLLLIAATLLTGLGIIHAIEQGTRRLEAHGLPPVQTGPPPVPGPAPVQTGPPPVPGPAPVPPPAPVEPALHARATLLQAANELQTLTPAERAEAERQVTLLASAGYPEVIRHSGGWDIMTPGGRIAATVRSMTELRHAVQRLGAGGSR